ncbi:hypothetical protein ACFL2H_03060 [Planctomycetota bacterium]
MRQTLFYIPHEIAGVPFLGFGWLLLLGVGSNHGKMPRVRGGIDSNALARDCLLGFASDRRAVRSAIVSEDRIFAWGAEPMMVFESRRGYSFPQTDTVEMEAGEKTTKHTEDGVRWMEYRGWILTIYRNA